MHNHEQRTCRVGHRLGRRAFLQGTTLTLTAAAVDTALVRAADSQPVLRIALVTDLHYADKPAAGTRHYRQTLDKLAEAAEHFQAQKSDFLVELGDLIDAADSVELEQRYLARINREFSAVLPERHYVLGNHCVDTLTKQEFLDGVGQAQSHYSFDRGGFHFIVLDSCFRSDGEPYQRKNFHWTDPNIPQDQLEWLRADLNKTALPTIVFAHQRLDATDNHAVKNAPEVRQILEASGKVRAVFQGHSHKNDLKEIGGIHYCTLVAMVEGSGVENNAYSLLDLEPDGTLRLTGFRRQNDYQWPQRG